VTVHFAIGLLAGGVLAGLAGSIFNSARLADAGRLAIWFGWAAAAVAVMTGLIAAGRIVKDPAIADLVETHETLAFLVLAVFAAVAVGWWMVEASHSSRLGPWLHLAGVIGLALVLATGYFGGEMVYQHGAGVWRAGSPVVRQQVLTPPVPRSADNPTSRPEAH
jgi:uncharacterized membrane protein